MYWYKLSFKEHAFFFAGVMLLLGISSCKQDSHAASDTMKFFDLKGYFESESTRLNKLNPLINKTAGHNAISETKKVYIPNWSTELSLFAESDINRPTWQASYNVQSSGEFLIYKAKDPDLKTRDIIIKKDGKKIKWILIFNHTRNLMFKKVLNETVEKLSYFPDSLYQIQKTQRVRLLGTNTYDIKGLFN